MLRWVEKLEFWPTQKKRLSGVLMAQISVSIRNSHLSLKYVFVDWCLRVQTLSRRPLNTTHPTMLTGQSQSVFKVLKNSAINFKHSKHFSHIANFSSDFSESPANREVAVAVKFAALFPTSLTELRWTATQRELAKKWTITAVNRAGIKRVNNDRYLLHRSLHCARTMVRTTKVEIVKYQRTYFTAVHYTTTKKYMVQHTAI